jgi:hypothetical protein
VQKAIDARSAMGAVGDLHAFMQYQAAQSMAKMAEQGGGEAGAMGLGMGAGFGMMFPGMIQQAMARGAAVPGGPPPGATGAPPPQPQPTPADGAAPAGRPDFSSLAPAAAAQAATATATQAAADPRTLVRSVCQAAGYAVAEHGDSWDVTVPVGPLRKQIVTVGFDRHDDDGHPLVSFRSTCGPATENNAMALLRYNTKMIHGAFAIETIEGREMIVVEANRLADAITPLSVSQVLTAIAWQADRVEEKLLGADQF